MGRRGSVVAWTILGLWAAVLMLVLAVPTSAAGVASSGTAPAASAADQAIGAPGPMHGAHTDNKLTHLSYARFGPAIASSVRTTHHTQFSPGCSGSSCPMGITDYGVNSTGSTYSYNADTMGSYADLSVFSIGSATGGGCLDPDASHCMTIQENTIVNGLPVENHKGEYWAQDVPEVALDGTCASPCVSNKYSVTWLDNIWNFSASGMLYLNGPSMSGNKSGDCSQFAVVSSEYYYCVGPTVYGLSLPFTFWAMTGTGPNTNKFYGPCSLVSGSPCIDFWGAIFVGSTEKFHAWFDEVTFTPGTGGAGAPSFHVADAATTYGLPFDAEWVMAGPGGGSSVSMTNTNAMLQSEYNTGVGSTTGLTGTWTNLRHAWSSGEDTAEHATNVDLFGFLGNRYLASATKGTDNPQKMLW